MPREEADGGAMGMIGKGEGGIGETMGEKLWRTTGR